MVCRWEVPTGLFVVETEIESVRKSRMKYKKRQVKLVQLVEIRAELCAALPEIDSLERETLPKSWPPLETMITFLKVWTSECLRFLKEVFKSYNSSRKRAPRGILWWKVLVRDQWISACPSSVWSRRVPGNRSLMCPCHMKEIVEAVRNPQCLSMPHAVKEIAEAVRYPYSLPMPHVMKNIVEAVRYPQSEPTPHAMKDIVEAVRYPQSEPMPNVSKEIVEAVEHSIVVDSAEVVKVEYMFCNSTDAFGEIYIFSTTE